MKKTRLGIADVCGIAALALSLIIAIGSMLIYAHRLQTNQERILDKLDQIEQASITAHSRPDDD